MPLKIIAIQSPLASKQSDWSLVFEWNSYKVHFCVLLWLFNAQKKKCWWERAFLASFEKAKVQLKESAYKGRDNPPPGGQGQPLASFMASWAVNAFATLVPTGITNSLPGSLCKCPDLGYPTQVKGLLRNSGEQMGCKKGWWDEFHNPDM
jgi:hypothetical protein